MRELILKRAFYILNSAWRKRYAIITPIVIMPILALIIGLSTPKKYQTAATILIQEPAIQNPFLKDLMVETNLKKRMEALNALVHSRHILTEVAVKQGLIDEDEEDNSKVDTIIANLSKSLKISLIGNELVRINYEASDISGMVDTLNLIALRFVERVIAPQRYSIYKSRDFLKKELEERRKTLIDSEDNLARYKSEYASELPELHARNVIRLTQIKDAMAERETALKGAKARYKNLKERVSQTNPIIGRIEEKIISMMGELAVLRARYTDQHSSIRALKRKIKSLEDERANTLSKSENIKLDDLERLWDRASMIESDNGQTPLLIEQLKQLQSVESEIQGLEQEVEALNQEFEENENKVRNYGSHEKEINNLEREITVNRKIYEDLSRRLQLAQVTGALGKFEETDRVKMIDPPFEPTHPINLSLSLYMIIGLISGVLVGASLAISLEIISTKLYSTDQFERILKTPVLGRITLQKAPGYDIKTGFLDLKILTNKYSNKTEAFLS